MTESQQLLEIKQQLAALQQKVDHLYEHLTGGVLGFNAQVPPLVTGVTEASAEVVELARRGDKVNALRLYRAQTGLSLAESKAAVDRLG